MDIMELGAIGELVGGVAVVATLAYLAIQIRQNTRSIRSTTHQAMVDSVLLTAASVSDDPSLAQLLAKTSRGEPLTDIEHIRFEALANRRFTNYESIFFQRQTIDPDMWSAWDAGYRRVIATPAMREFWDASKPQFFKQFRDYVDTQVYRPAP